jgi:hypothetical protein
MKQIRAPHCGTAQEKDTIQKCNSQPENSESNSELSETPNGFDGCAADETTMLDRSSESSTTLEANKPFLEIDNLLAAGRTGELLDYCEWYTPSQSDYTFSSIRMIGIFAHIS